MRRRITVLFIIYCLLIIFLMYYGFMPPRPPEIIPVQSNILSELTMELKVDNPEVDKIKAEIFS